MIAITLNSLHSYLLENNDDAKIHEENRQVSTILKIGNAEFPFFIRIYEKSNLLQLLVFMPSQIKPEAFNDLARLLHLINKELDIPGFGMDENASYAFYRCMLPIPDQQIDRNLLDSYLKSIKLICESISPSVLAVATGAVTYEEVLKKAKQENS